MINSLITKSVGYILALIAGLTIGYIYGSHHERETWLKIEVQKQQQITAEIQRKSVAYNNIIAEKESNLLIIQKENVKLKEKLKANEKYIDSTNTIRRNFVRHVSGDMLKSSSSIVAKNATDADLESVPATKVGEYIIDSQEHDKKCVNQLNALIDAINVK